MQDQAGDGAVIVVDEADGADLALDIDEARATIDQPGAGAPCDDRIVDLVRFRHFAGNYGEDVGLGDDALDAAVFVQHHGHAHRCLAEDFQHPQDGRGFVKSKDRLHAGVRIESLARRNLVQQILGMHDAQHFVDAALAQQQTGMVARDDVFDGGVVGVVDVDPIDIGARRHDAADGVIGKVQHTFDHVALGLGEDAGLSTFGDHGLHFFFGHLILALAAKSDQGEDALGRDAQQQHQRRADLGDDRHRHTDAHGDRLGMVHGDAFGYQFADDERAIGDAGNHDGNGDGIGIGCQQRPIVQHVGKRRRQGGARISAGDDADQRNADLYRREKQGRIFGQLDRLFGALVTGIGERAQPRASRRNDGKLRHREEAVQQDQQDNDEDLEPDRTIF